MSTRPRGTTQLPVSGNTMSVQDSHSETGPVITMERGQGVWRQPKTRAGGSGPTPRHRRPRRGRGLSGVPATQEHGGRGQPDDDPQNHNAVALSRSRAVTVEVARSWSIVAWVVVIWWPAVDGRNGLRFRRNDAGIARTRSRQQDEPEDGREGPSYTHLTLPT